MQSFQFTTKQGRGGVILCELTSLEQAVTYLQNRFADINRVDHGRDYWTLDEGFSQPVITQSETE